MFKKIVRAPDGKEVVKVILDGSEDYGIGLAIAEIGQSVPHKHLHTRESYQLMSGRLEVTIGTHLYRLTRPGQTLEIPIGAVHSARSLEERPANVIVLTQPPWSEEDHVTQL